jgi:hypothetical protein
MSNPSKTRLRLAGASLANSPAGPAYHVRRPELHSEKLGSAFAARLSRFPAGAHVRALLLLGQPTEPPTRDRAEQIRRVKQSAAAALDEIDQILTAHSGRRLESEPSSLGHVTVETTPAGIRALAKSDQVRAVLEDQAVRLLD